MDLTDNMTAQDNMSQQTMAHDMGTHADHDKMLHDMTATVPSGAPAGSGHVPIPLTDPDHPQNWPVLKRVYATAASFLFAFSSAFGATCYTAGVADLQKDMGISMMEAVWGFSIYLFAIILSPIVVPHLSERLGRTAVYRGSVPFFAIFTVGAALSRTLPELLAARFFAGLFAGPSLVLIEGSFADIWSADSTVSYYAVLTSASFVGAALGPWVGGFLVDAGNWRWCQWVTLAVSIGSMLFGYAIPETYAREILRRRLRCRGLEVRIPPALSGVTIRQMVQTTLFNPLRQLLTEPIVVLITLYLAYNFAVVFSFFISVPVVLSATYGFGVVHIGWAFTAAAAGALLAMVTSILIEKATPIMRRSSQTAQGLPSIECRLIPAMVGSILVPGSLFLIAWTASPHIDSAAPVIGTLFYVWGNAMVLTGFVSYLFDAYPAAGTLSALTVAACVRLGAAGGMSLAIVPIIVKLGGAWCYSMLALIGVAMFPFPVVLYIWGPSLRAGSRYSAQGFMPAPVRTSMDHA
ncbi:hypothetical protein HKX48_009409 [Thoreauomyces humboldtii]|nr:hypothetical protein HKX48_009409 [Thoreauomyces humboldtii]